MIREKKFKKIDQKRINANKAVELTRNINDIVHAASVPNKQITLCFLSIFHQGQCKEDIYPDIQCRNTDSELINSNNHS